jgi:hypothetical protein
MEVFLLDNFKSPASSSTMSKSIKYSGVSNGAAHQMIIPEVLDYVSQAAGPCA